MKIDEMKLLAGDSIPLMDNTDIKNPKIICEVHPFTVGDIKNIGGETVFNSYLGVLTVDKDRLFKNEEDSANKPPDITNFELVYTICGTDENFRNMYLKAMSFILKENVVICNIGFYIGEIETDRIISNDNYNDLIHIIKLQNGIEKLDSEALDNPASEKAKELLEKRKLLREKLNKAKNKENGGDGEPLTLADLVSILCANGNGINIFNVWDLSFYAFNDQFNRMKMFEDYQVNIQSLLAGANPDDIEFKHWMSKID